MMKDNVVIAGVGGLQLRQELSCFNSEEGALNRGPSSLSHGRSLGLHG